MFQINLSEISVRFYFFNLFCIFNLLDHARILDTKMSFHKIFNYKTYEKNKF